MMEGRYQVTLEDRIVGYADVSIEGLYYHFCCRCNFNDAVIHKVILKWERGERNLGILVPYADGFGLNTRVPMKYFQGDHFRFEVISKREGRFVEINPEEPFLYLKDLQNAYYEKRNGQIGIYILPS